MLHFRKLAHSISKYKVGLKSEIITGMMLTYSFHQEHNTTNLGGSFSMGDQYSAFTDAKLVACSVRAALDCQLMGQHKQHVQG
jgi:hypothetical protein